MSRRRRVLQAIGTGALLVVIAVWLLIGAYLWAFVPGFWNDGRPLITDAGPYVRCVEDGYPPSYCEDTFL